MFIFIAQNWILLCPCSIFFVPLQVYFRVFPSGSEWLSEETTWKHELCEQQLILAITLVTSGNSTSTINANRFPAHCKNEMSLYLSLTNLSTAANNCCICNERNGLKCTKNATIDYTKTSFISKIPFVLIFRLNSPELTKLDTNSFFTSPFMILSKYGLMWKQIILCSMIMLGSCFTISLTFICSNVCINTSILNLDFISSGGDCFVKMVAPHVF